MPTEPDRPPRVLLVDDNEDNREVYEQYLSSNGFLVQTATDGEDALHKAAAALPDVVVMDLAMPVMDGWEATRRLKAADATRTVPVLVLSAHAMGEERREAVEAGCDAFLTKPLLPDRLADEIRTILKRPRSSS